MTYLFVALGIAADDNIDLSFSVVAGAATGSKVVMLLLAAAVSTCRRSRTSVRMHGMVTTMVLSSTVSSRAS